MVEYGALSKSEEEGDISYQVASMEMLHRIGESHHQFLESYMCVLRACQSFAAVKITEKDLKENSRVCKIKAGCGRYSQT